MSTVISKIYLSSERREKLLDLTDAHSIPYQNEIQYFSLRHEEKRLWPHPSLCLLAGFPSPAAEEKMKQLPGLTTNFKKAIWIIRL